MKERIKLDFADFWPGFEKTNNFFYNNLVRRFEVAIAPDPDLLIYSCYGRTFRRFKCLRVFYSGENRAADFSECDFAFTYDYLDNPDHFRLPHWVVRYRPEDFVKPNVDPGALLRAKSGFCSFVVSNPLGRTRNRFFEKLERYKRIESGGRFRNNVGGPVADKAAFIGRYKFNIAFENASFPGYTTEKLFDPLVVHAVPIYWGDPLAARDFDPGCFVSRHDFASDDELIERVIELDRNDDDYMRLLAAPWFRDGKVPECADPEWLLDRFQEILRSGRRPIGSRPATPAWMARRFAGWWARRRRRKGRIR